MIRNSVRNARALYSTDSVAFSAHMAGRYAEMRDENLVKARLSDTKPMRKLFVGFARDHHREYLINMRVVRSES